MMLYLIQGGITLAIIGMLAGIWAQKFDQKKLVDYLKKGSKAIMSAISHRNTVTKDTFMLTGFSDALLELDKQCKLN